MTSLTSRNRNRARAGNDRSTQQSSSTSGATSNNSFLGRFIANKSAALAACSLLAGTILVGSTGWFGGGYDPLSSFSSPSSSAFSPSESTTRSILSAPIRFLHSRQEENLKIRPLKVYMYDTLPDWLDADIRTAEYDQEWLTRSAEYNSDLWMYQFIANAPFRTLNPAEATLFYVPLLPTRAMHLKLHTQGWEKANRAASDLVKWGLHWIAHHWPYWYRNNGADHFMTLTSDHGRCNILSQLPKEVYGDMFIVQHLGDLTLWYGDEDIQGAIGSTAKVEQEDRWPCFRRGRDVLLPAYLPVNEVPHVSPFNTESRGIGALWRFDLQAATAHHEYHHFKVRQELGNMFHRDPIYGSDWKLYQSLNDTMHDMTNSTVCLTPPGVVSLRLCD